MDREERLRLKRSLRRKGFDRCLTFTSGTLKVGCSQCEALVICGIATHETGCPNQKSGRSQCK